MLHKLRQSSVLHGWMPTTGKSNNDLLPIFKFLKLTLSRSDNHYITAHLAISAQEINSSAGQYCIFTAAILQDTTFCRTTLWIPWRNHSRSRNSNRVFLCLMTGDTQEYPGQRCSALRSPEFNQRKLNLKLRLEFWIRSEFHCLPIGHKIILCKLCQN